MLGNMVETGQPATVELKRKMKALLDNAAELCADVAFQVEGKQFFAHRCILATASEAFCALLKRPTTLTDSCGVAAREWQGFFREATQPIIQIHGLSASIFQTLLRYVYTGELSFATWEEALEVLLACNMYLLDDAAALCRAHLASNLSPENVFKILEVAETLDDRELLAVANEYTSENAQAICTAMIKGLLQPDEVALFVQRDDLHTDTQTLAMSLALWSIQHQGGPGAAQNQEHGPADRVAAGGPKAEHSAQDNTGAPPSEAIRGALHRIAKWDVQATCATCLTICPNAQSVRAHEIGNLTQWVGAVGCQTYMFPMTQIDFTVDDVGALGGLAFGLAVANRDWKGPSWKERAWMLRVWAVGGPPKVYHKGKEIACLPTTCPKLMAGDRVSITVNQSNMVTFAFNNKTVVTFHADLPKDGHLRPAVDFCRAAAVTLLKVTKDLNWVPKPEDPQM